ncbi:MAG: hypothetical protein WC819_05375 [Parcubacteria group bacterium]|jgi:hypothetical protein
MPTQKTVEKFMVEGFAREMLNGKIVRFIVNKELCPDEFTKFNNPWVNYVSSIFSEESHARGRGIFSGIFFTFEQWKWKDAQISESEKHLHILLFDTILHNSHFNMGEKGIIAGWFLSEILSEVPESEGAYIHGERW